MENHSNWFAMSVGVAIVLLVAPPWSVTADGIAASGVIDSDILPALRDSRPEQQQRGLQDLTTALATTSNIDEVSEELILELRVLVMSDHAPVSLEAARALLMAAGQTSETAELIVDRAAGAADANDGARYFTMLDGRTVRGRVFDRLLVVASGPTDERSVNAMEVLLRSTEEPPSTLVPHVIRHVEHPRYYGRQMLVTGLRKFGANALPYLSELRQVRERLHLEASLPVEQRTVNVSHDGDTTTIDEEPLAIPTLDETISYLEGLSQNSSR